MLGFQIISGKRWIFLLLGLLLAALVISYITVKTPLILGLVLFGLIAGILFLFITFVYPKVGFFSAFVLPFFLFILDRWIGYDIQFGSAIQAIMAVTLVIILFKKFSRNDLSFSFLKNNVSIAFLALMLYNVFQGLNPNQTSIIGWLIVLKGSLSLICTYIVAMYLCQDLKFIKQFIALWIFMAFISALYACHQEWFGLADFELRYIHADQLRYNRIFNQGHYRKFSLLSDPAAFGMFMAASSIITFVVAASPIKNRLRIILVVAGIFMLLAMSYSGTRTAVAMIPAAILLIGLMTITNRRVLFFSACLALIFGFIIFGPIYGNTTVNRIRSTFDTENASLNVRDVNKQFIQPYIWEHPFMGGGLLTTGPQGARYSPNHYLAGFPPDSGYLKTALETGITGLVLFMVFIFVGLKEGIRNYYHTRQGKLKYVYLAFVAFVFACSIALYAQSVTAQIPIAFLFYPVMGFMAGLKKMHQ